MTDSLEREIRTLRTIFWSDRDPDGRVFAPLADALRRSGDLREAVVTLNEGLDRLPAFPTGHVVASRIYLDSGLLAEAEMAARRALELDEENVEALGSLIRALEVRQAIEEALETRERLAEVDPEMVGDLGPAPELAPLMELAALAPDEVEEEEVVDLAALAPEEPAVVEETVVEEVEEEVVDLAALAPEEPAIVEETVVEVVEEDVIDLAALAPDEPEEDEVEEEVVDLAALAPEEPAVVEATVVEEVEEEVVDLAALAPDEPEPEADTDDEAEPETEPEAYIQETAGEPIPTRTLADLYARQGLAASALRVYRQLLEVSPDDEELQERVRAMEAAAAEKGADVEESAWDPDAQIDEHEVETPFAWTAEESDAEAEGEEEEDGPAIGDYFSGLLGWDAEDDEA